jgi:hypothetical protein
VTVTDEGAAVISGHWLTVNHGYDPEVGGPIVGCNCGFMSDLEKSCGYGDDVVQHIAEVAVAAERQRVGSQRAPEAAEGGAL